MDVISTVGCGDATLAGFALAASQGTCGEQAIRLAAACGAANCVAFAPGRIEESKVLELLPKIEVRQLAFEIRKQPALRASEHDAAAMLLRGWHDSGNPSRGIIVIDASHDWLWQIQPLNLASFILQGLVGREKFPIPCVRFLPVL